MATPKPAADGTTVDPPEDSVGDRLREGRRALGLTQSEVAKRLEVSRRAVSEWETNVRAPHSHIPALAALYGVSTTFLLYGVEPASVELRELRARVDALADDVAETRLMLSALAEQTDSLFVEIRRVLALNGGDV